MEISMNRTKILCIIIVAVIICQVAHMKKGYELVVNEYNLCVEKVSTAYIELQTDIYNSLSGENIDLNSLLRNYSNFIRALERWEPTYRKLAERGCLPEDIYENSDSERRLVSDMIFDVCTLADYMVGWYIAEDDLQFTSKTQIYTILEDFDKKIEILDAKIQPSLAHAIKFYFDGREII